MTQVWNAREAADAVYDGVRESVQDLLERGVTPCMAAILVGGDPASAYYAEAKRKIAGRLGVAFRLHALPGEVSREELLALIASLNADSLVHGILLELPLPDGLPVRTIEAAIDPAKDIDGVTPANKLAVLTGGPGLYPATPQACIRLAKHYGSRLEGARVVLVGRGQTVGLPLFHLLQREQATVTVCHSRTRELAEHLAQAELVFVAVGRPGVVTGDRVHAGLAVVDAGINELADGRIAGDVSPDAAGIARALSPVPGGVGTLTTAILFENLLRAAERQADAIASAAAGTEEAQQAAAWDRPIRSFLAQAGSAAPTPGGGSVAALAAALGASMASMVGRLSQSGGPADADSQMRGLTERMTALTAACEQAQAADIAAFRRYMAALRLPKGSDAEKAARSAAIQSACAEATEAPLSLMALCRDGLRAAGAAADTANKHVISDLGIGVLLFEASARSALLTVEINLASLKDAAAKRRYEEKASALMAEAEALKANALAIVNARIGG